jgi:aminoglycoside/choline kinase family phosphotransferase
MEEIKAFALTHIKPRLKNEDAEIDKIFGQASARSYFRIRNNKIKPGGKSARPLSWIVMKLPEGFASPAEEITHVDQEAPQELPFLNIQRYLKSLELPVPEVLAWDEKTGCVLLEDLGDRSLENAVTNATTDFKLFYYKKVLDLLIDLQDKTQKNPTQDCTAYHRHFDANLLNWEFNHFLEYGISERKNIGLSDAIKTQFNALTAPITSTITAMPQGFTHRDFQSRNLMFKDYTFTLIDFQDALVGPVVYDLVALLRDSYITITVEELDMLLDYYASKLSDSHPYFGKKDQLKEDFHLVTLQRKLKDAGRFQYIDAVKGNPRFLEHVPQSLAYVKNAFEKLSTHRELRAFIAEFVEELR